MEISLNGTWRMRNIKEDSWIEATVPGSVLNDLLENELIEDPYYRDNEWKTLEVLKNDFEYEREFYVEEELLSMDKVILECDGIDTIADLFINDHFVASVNDMHRIFKFDIKEALKVGKNKIRVYFHSAAEYALKKHKENPVYVTSDTVNGFEQVRKAHCMYGWDWGPQLPDMGLWRDIKIKAFQKAHLEDVYIKQKHVDSKVNIEVDIKVNQLTLGENHCRIEILDPEEQLLVESFKKINDKEKMEVTIDNPLLWWPNGYGQQPLYRVNVTLEDSQGHSLDEKSYRIGLRTLTIKQEKDQWGESFEFNVNGVSIFAMGANYIPEDNILSRCSKERSRQLIEQCVKANFNCLRVWGGGFFAEDYFYDLCDEYGIILWQDFLFACAPYDLNDEFEENIKKETEDNIKRLRHHASLGVWCGNNELEWGWCDWDMGFGTDPKLKANYIKQFEYILPNVAKENDPNTFYWVASPSSGGAFDQPNDPNRGDVHYWEVWHRLKPFTEYRKYYFRFCSEFGFQSFPSFKTVESFTLPEDRNIFSYVMENHQKNGEANGRILGYLAQTFKYPKDFETLIYTSQILQAEAIKYGVEHWRRNRGRCMGAIYWQINDCWPVASWSSIDYFGRWKALHYFAKRFFAPIMISAEETENTARLSVVNESFNDFCGQAKWALRKNTGEIIEHGFKDVTIKGLTSEYCIDLNLEQHLKTKEDIFTTYLEYEVLKDEEVISEGTVLFTKPKYFKFLDPKIEVTITECNDYFKLLLTTENYAKYVALDAKNFDFIASDNYFDLSKGKNKIITIDKKDISDHVNLQMLKENLTIISTVDIDG